MKVGDRQLSWLVCFAAIVGGALGALAQGQDHNWDLRNYQLYLPWSVLHGRLDQDVAPAGIQSFHNPVLYLGQYAVLAALPPRGAALALGAVQGLNLWLVFLIARRVLTGVALARALALAAAAFAFTGSEFFDQLGRIRGDTVVALLVLGGLTLVLGTPVPAARHALAAGAAFGLAAGLKLTAGLYLPGAAVALACVRCARRARIALLGRFLLAFTAAIVLCHGPWSWVLWQRYHNPVFPYANTVFQSPWFPTSFLRSRPMPALAPGQLALHPLVALRDDSAIRDPRRRDLRLPAAFVLALAAGVVRVAGGVRVARGVALPPGAAARLAAFAAVSYGVWAVLFNTYRYLVVVELLAGAVIALLVARLGAARRRAGVVAVSVLTLIGAGALLEPRAHRRAFSATWSGVTVPTVLTGGETTVLMIGDAPLAYVIPELPAHWRFVRTGYFERLTEGTPFAARRQALLAAPDQPRWVLFSAHQRHEARAEIARRRLRTTGPCTRLSPKPFVLLCPAARRALPLALRQG